MYAYGSLYMTIHPFSLFRICWFHVVFDTVCMCFCVYVSVCLTARHLFLPPVRYSRNSIFHWFPILIFETNSENNVLIFLQQSKHKNDRYSLLKQRRAQVAWRNVESRNYVHCIKYVWKRINKGLDTAIYILLQNDTRQISRNDEDAQYYRGRYSKRRRHFN